MTELDNQSWIPSTQHQGSLNLPHPVPRGLTPCLLFAIMSSNDALPELHLTENTGDTAVADLVILLLEGVCTVVLYKPVSPERFPVEYPVGLL